MTELNPYQFHPEMHEYQSGGMGHRDDDPSRSVVGMVPVKTLKTMHGNSPHDEERVGHYQQQLREGKGLKEPLTVDWSPRNKVANVGEGNHKLEALSREGHTHAPVKVNRSNFLSNDSVDPSMGRTVQPLDPGPSPWKGNLGEDYWPSDIHPSFLFHDRREP